MYTCLRLVVWDWKFVSTEGTRCFVPLLRQATLSPTTGRDIGMLQALRSFGNRTLKGFHSTSAERVLTLNRRQRVSTSLFLEGEKTNDRHSVGLRT